MFIISQQMVPVVEIRPCANTHASLSSVANAMGADVKCKGYGAARVSAAMFSEFFWIISTHYQPCICGNLFIATYAWLLMSTRSDGIIAQL